MANYKKLRNLAIRHAQVHLQPKGEEPIDIDLGRGNERSQRSRLGKLLGKKRDTVIGGYRIVAAGDRQRAQLWRLEPVPDAESGSE